jgi:ADP-ribose pyrophosphatase YjhB (NUDIX family)
MFIHPTRVNTPKQKDLIFSSRQNVTINECYHSPAFQSLSFKGKRGYEENILARKPKINREQQELPPKYKSEVTSDEENRPRCSKSRTYGAILRTTTDVGYKYALVQGRYTGKWSFPKGHSIIGETPLECTLRELKEETGLNNLPHPVEYIQIGYGYYYLFIVDRELPLNPCDTNEIMDARWVTLKEMEWMSVNADVSNYRKHHMELNM